MKDNKKQKDFDAVKMMRDIRNKISSDIKDMTFEELKGYIDNKLKHKTRLVGKK